MRKFLKDFSRAEIREIAINYSQEPVVSRWSEVYGISADMLKKLRYKAISDCIVENDAAKIILESVRKRAILHSEEGKDAALYSFSKKCEMLISARKSFMLPDEEAVLLTQEYASSSLSKKQFCAENALTCSLFDRALIHVTCDCMVEDDVVEALEEKALSSDLYDEITVNELFEKIAKARRRFTQVHS